MDKEKSILDKLSILLQSAAQINDTDEERLRKSTLLLLSCLFAFAGLLWGVIYFLNGLILSGSIPFVYGIISTLSILLFIKTKKYKFFYKSQIILVLFLPFLLQLSLGGFITSSVVIIWAVLSPIGALYFFPKRSDAIKCFLAYIAALFVAFILNDYVVKNFKPDISETFINIFFLMNLISVTTLIFTSIYYTLNQQDKLKRLLEEKNHEIIDSINYAKRIQQARLPKKEDIYSALSNSFVLFKPKDIVSGDFYYFHKKNALIFIASADCTGHGVPGALMSMVGSEKLEDAVSQTNDTSIILNILNKGIKTSLRQSEHTESTRDGMDIAICAINLESRIVKYAGANRPLWIIRNGASIVEEIKATKAAIGGITEDKQKFDSHELQLMEGDTIYLFTDGFADQFGGLSGKKLMTKKFKEILLKIQGMQLNEQEQFLDGFIENWKAGTEQVDDILVIGLRL
ncbi:MAG: SpoIIE family protein phosphatase [Bacteroidia bacterium]|nr:SpoIIE family protein phosphatase [Bacteroidia bacterium]